MRRLRSIALRADLLPFVLLPLLWVSLFAYAGRPLVSVTRAAGLPPAIAWCFIFAAALAPILPIVRRRKGGVSRRAAPYWIAYSTLAVFSTLLVSVMFADFFRLMAGLASVVVHGGALTMATLATASVLFVVGFFQARCPQVRTVSVSIDGLPAELDGYRIVQWSDVHVSPTIRRPFIERLVERTNALEPDAVAITGDFADGSVADLGGDIESLADLKTRDGVFYVTGNHEYYWNAESWITALTRLGVTFLKNENRLIRRGPASLVMAGVTDPVGRGSHEPDAASALRGAPAGSIKVMLAHRPQASSDASSLGVHLQLSGHTHGGQFFPFNLLIRRFQPIVAGLHQVGKTWLYVSRGTGYWGPPSRLFVGGEITLIELRREA